MDRLPVGFLKTPWETFPFSGDFPWVRMTGEEGALLNFHLFLLVKRNPLPPGMLLIFPVLELGNSPREMKPDGGGCMMNQQKCK